VKSIKYLLLNLALVKAVACNVEQPTQPMSYFPLLIFSLPSPAAHAAIRLDAVRQGAEQLQGRSSAGGEKQLDRPLAPASPTLARERLQMVRFPSHPARMAPCPPL
jgi:hypothetical protein